MEKFINGSHFEKKYKQIKWCIHNYCVIQVLAHTLAENPISADSPLFSNEPVIKTSLCLQQQQNYPWLHLYYDISNCKARIVLPSEPRVREEYFQWLPVLWRNCQSSTHCSSKTPTFLPNFWLTTQWSVNNSMGPKQCQNFYLATLMKKSL